MFAEKLTIPNSESSSKGVSSEFLLESAQFMAIQSRYNSEPDTYDNRVEAAYSTAELLRKTLTFSDHTRRQPELTPEWVADHHTTNCYGHSIIMSECLEQLNIDHRIGFANQHGFVLLEDIESGRVNLIDTPVEKLCIDITPALGSIALDNYTSEYGSVNYLWGSTILRRSHFGNKERALAKRPWMSFKTTDNSFPWSREDTEESANRLILRTYKPQQGRDVLLSFDNFIHAISRRDTLRAHEWIQGLGGTYPDIDKRNRLSAPSRLVRGLGEKVMINEALNDIQIIENSLLPFTDDIILRLWPIDKRRGLGVQVRSGNLLRQSIDEYDQLYESRKESGASTQDIEGRMRKAKDQLDRIEN